VDQCTGWLAVESIDEAFVSITPGWSHVEGMDRAQAVAASRASMEQTGGAS